MTAPVTFSIEKQSTSSLARAGVMHTPHGDITTPTFFTVGTKGTVKSLKPEDLEKYVGTQLLLANTYHLFLQPGAELIQSAGGLATFTNWHKPTMTDSGGFQVFSLGAAFGKGVTKFATGDVAAEAGLNVYSKEIASEHGKLCVIDEEGVTFTSHIDGSMHRFTPERSVEIQQQIGADIIVAFDECTSPTAEYEYQKEAMDRTHRWAKRSLLMHKQSYQALQRQGMYGVVQGGRHLDLRRESAHILGAMDFAGYGIGGSFSKADLGKSLQVVNEILPVDKPRHLLGIGEPEDLLQGVLNGCDTFDCVAATRIARTGTLYHDTGESNEYGLPIITKLNLRKGQYANDLTPFDASDSPIGAQYTKAYVAHLFRAKEMLGPHLASLHNLWTIVNYSKLLRQRILEGRI